MLLLGVAQAQDHSVMVTDDVVVTSLDRKEIRRLFTGQSGIWSDGRQVNLLLPPVDSAAMAWLSDQVLGLPPDIYHRYLLEKAYRAGRAPPKIATSVDEIIQDASDLVGVLTVLPLPAGGGFRMVRID